MTLPEIERLAAAAALLMGGILAARCLGRLFGLLLLGLRRLLPAFPKRFSARVVSAGDGDTIRVRLSFGRTRCLRLLGMDAPELAQRFGVEARDALRRLVLGKRVRAVAIGVDRYGRWLSRIEADRRDVSLEMLRLGLAWPYERYFRSLSPEDRRRYAEAAARAKALKAGLWRDAHPEAPRDWRARHRSLAERLLFGLKRLLRSLLRRLFGR